jgi:NADP-dependent 3-hydroxy acid dehydrogenase YdfG
MDLQNKVAVVTGASQGIGESIALTLAKEGVHLILIGRNAEKLELVATKCLKLGGKATIFPFDLTQIDQIPKLVSKILTSFPAINFVVNNAGTYVKGDPYESDTKDWDYALDLNFRSVYHLTNRILPSITSNEGAIFNISSIAGLSTYKGGEIYTATKYALRAYSNCLFDSVREKGIKVTCLFPGFVNTELGREENIIPEKMIQPDDIASAVLWAIKLPTTACPTEITVRPQFSPYR